MDTETGEVTVLKAVTCCDVGRAINRAAAIGQLAGGGMQGLGYALMENLIVEKGVIKTPSFAEYLIPTSMDFPTTQVIVLESGTGVGPFGAKGIGEPSLTPAAPAIASAVSDAIGVPIHELPITPERVLNALKKASALRASAAAEADRLRQVKAGLDRLYGIAVRSQPASSRFAPAEPASTGG